MTNTETSESQARAQLESIVAMVKRLEHAESCEDDDCEDPSFMQWIAEKSEHDTENYHDADAAREAIEQDALSVEVRSGWVPASDAYGAAYADRMAPAEYKILLCWGGPAVRIVGELDEHGEPETARLEHQDWGTEWTEYPFGRFDENSGIQPAGAWREKSATERDALLTYARCFYYGS